MREIHRKIVSALIWSKDWKLLMGKKDPLGGGVYTDCWHIPWGWIDDWESMIDGLIREIEEEIWLDISNITTKELPGPGQGSSEKIMKDTWEKLLCHMEFNRFEIQLDQNHDKIELHLNDDLVEIKRFTKEELKDVNQVPGGKEFMQEIGYISI